MGDESGPGPQAMASGADSEVPGIASVISGFGSTEAALAAVHDVALLDLDGVVYVGAGAVAHAAESLDAALDVHGMRSAFVTNNAARTPATVAAHLVALGLRATPADVVTSAQAGARMLAERFPRGSHVLVIGGPGVGEALRERGLVPVGSVDDGAVAVMQGYGPEVGWRSLAEGSLAIGRGLLWVATNLDRTIPSPRGRVLGNGSMVAALRHATGAEPLVAGKPEPPLMIESVQRSGAVRPIVVGDRLDTDIEGANRSGIPSLLVLTGVTDWQELLDAAPLHRPTYLGPDLRALLAPAPPVELRSGDDVVHARCGRVVVRIPTAMAGTRGPDVGAGSDVPGGRVDLHAQPWWLPEALRDGGRHQGDAGDVDLDAVRAVVAAAWLIADSGMAIAGPAQVHAATG